MGAPREDSVIPLSVIVNVLAADSGVARKSAYAAAQRHLATLDLDSHCLQAFDLLWGDEYAEVAGVAEEMHCENYRTVNVYIEHVLDRFRVELGKHLHRAGKPADGVVFPDFSDVRVVELFFAHQALRHRAQVFEILKGRPVFIDLDEYDRDVLRTKYGNGGCRHKAVALTLGFTEREIAGILRGAHRKLRVAAGLDAKCRRGGGIARG